MPCYTIQETTVNLTAARADVFRAALEAEGWTVEEEKAGVIRGRNYASGSRVIWTRGGKVELTTRGDAQAEERGLKRAYSKAAVYQQAKRYGWRVTENKGKLIVQKR